MSLNPDDIKAALRAKVIELAEPLGMDASGVTDDDILPATGFLDSGAILELVVWFEATYDIRIKQEEMNIDNLGSINAMTDFLLARKQG
ncbi:acyl carrier protein [Methylomonas sp. SURF-1]|uniref:Acyl carrier protein n=1 Tax=Methylomonas aurea TaxID=2952224 RepID=A0ABT1UER2_9GAMM|nr:acyl carrier protein [Methylomonas sp. SURF-1]MCQ8180655.1 acyl carrier protein [Methylomonas sp. SURF-1]